MEKEPLLSSGTPRRHRSPSQPPPPEPPLPSPLAEENEITIPPLPHTSSSSEELKNRLIFGSPSSWSSNPNLHRSNTAPTMISINEIDHFPQTNRPHFGKSSIVKQGFIFLIIYLILGVIIYSFNRDKFRLTETHPVVDALYFCIVTMCAIGYSDITPDSKLTKLFAITFVLVGFGFINILLGGILSYILDLQENYLLRGIRGGGSCIIDVNKRSMRIRMKVGLALSVVVVCIGIGVVFMHFLEELDWFDSFYLSVISVTTVGYGEKGFSSLTGRIFGSIWLLVSTLSVARAFLYLAEVIVEKQCRRMAKWLLGKDMTVAEFLAAILITMDLCKSEYVIYKLKEMGLVSEKHILEICNQFEKLDTGKCGRITLANLIENSSMIQDA